MRVRVAPVLLAVAVALVATPTASAQTDDDVVVRAAIPGYENNLPRSR